MTFKEREDEGQRPVMKADRNGSISASSLDENNYWIGLRNDTWHTDDPEKQAE